MSELISLIDRCKYLLILNQTQQHVSNTLEQQTGKDVDAGQSVNTSYL